ncbi:MAG TPA: hypothetical protein VNW15_12225 [Rhizomicrobium sp.]|jgi:hypothetical protein|nr:hypothetical protein [Rhizomicrobium sp.]
MTRLWWIAVALLWATPVAAENTQGPDQAVGFDIFGSSDADHFHVLKLGASYYPDYVSTEQYLGGRFEHVDFSSSAGGAVSQERGYLNFANGAGDWKWNGAVGTDGRSLLGSGSAYTQGSFRQEYFINRDLVETPMGLDRGLYFTLLGGSYEIPLDDRNTLTALVGAQVFSGKNYRLHLRSNYVYVIEPDWGLSLQFRARYFWDSYPREFDYFSPRWYMEGVPTVQLRRFYDRWQFLAAAGWGLRRNNGTSWQSARLAQVSIISPRFGSGWLLDATLLYSNQPIAASYAYSYDQATLSLIKRF